MQYNAVKIEAIYAKIFERSKSHQLGLYEAAAKLGNQSSAKRVLFLKELTQQIISCPENMVDIFGEEIVKCILELNLKVRIIKIKQPKVLLRC